MSDEPIVVRRGKKIEPEEAARLDPAQRSVGRPAPPRGEVSGQGRFVWVVCPWCGAMNYVHDVHDTYCWHTCWYCGESLRV